jgi:hypothetical protein
MAAVERNSLPAARRLTIAVFEDHLGRPLDQQRLPAGGVFVQRCHKAVFRLEWDRVDPPVGGLLDLPFETELIAKRIERPLGRVALHLPRSFFPADLGIVAQHRDAAHQPENRIRSCRCPML